MDRAYPSGMQLTATRTSTSKNGCAGYDEAFISSYLGSEKDSYNLRTPRSSRASRHLQYYSVAEDELAKIFAGQMTAQEGADKIAAAWEKLTTRSVATSRSRSTRPRWACNGRDISIWAAAALRRRPFCLLGHLEEWAEPHVEQR